MGNERTDLWIHGRMDGGTNGRIDGWLVGWMEGWVSLRTEVHFGWHAESEALGHIEQVKLVDVENVLEPVLCVRLKVRPGEREGWTGVRVGEWMNGRTDGWMGGERVGWMCEWDGRVDEWISTCKPPWLTCAGSSSARPVFRAAFAP